MTPVAHRCDLYDVANDEHEDAEAQTASSSPPVRSIGSAESTYQCTDRHERHEQRLIDRYESSVSRRTLSKAIDEVVEKQHA